MKTMHTFILIAAMATCGQAATETWVVDTQAQWQRARGQSRRFPHRKHPTSAGNNRPDRDVTTGSGEKQLQTECLL